MYGPVECVKFFFNDDVEIYIKDFPVRKDFFQCETFNELLPHLNRFLHFHMDNLLALSLVKSETFALQSHAQRQTAVRQVTTSTMKYRR